MFKLARVSLTLFIILFFAKFNSQSREYVRLFKEGNMYLENEDYDDALKSFLAAYKYDSSNANINFKIGCCYAELPHHKEWGEKYFAKAIKDVTTRYKEQNPRHKKAPYFTYFYYAELLHNEDKLEESRKMFKIYERYLDAKRKKDDFELLGHFEEMVDVASEKEAHPINALLTNLGDSINSSEAEYSPVTDGSENILMFTYRGRNSMGASEGLRAETGKYFEDIFMSTRLEDGSWSKAKPVTTLNTKGNDATVSMSHDGNVLIVYRDDEGDGNLYYTERKGNEWGTLNKFSDEIDSKYWEPSASFSPDMNTLYFVSDRPGGFGGRDLYKCKKLPNGKWSKPQNLGPKINTKYDEESPFVHANGKDFYFSSNGHKSMGGFDIMKCELSDSGAVGDIFYFPYPINTTGDDLFYFVSPDGKRAYYSTSHYDTIGKGDNDIYILNLEKDAINDYFFVRGGYVFEDREQIKIGLRAEIYNKSNNKLSSKFIPNSAGEFVAILYPDSIYQIVYLSGKDTLQRQEVRMSKKDSIVISHGELELQKFIIRKAKPDRVQIDSDKDGVADDLDLCTDVQGPMENKGCPWPDSDQDGIVDTDDSCPIISGTVANKGCPEIKQEEMKIIEEAFSQLEFAKGKDVILKKSFNSLNTLATLIKQHDQDWQIKLAGHTDNQGSAASNMKLSERRAKAVKKYLVNKGVSDKKFIVEWHGHTKPVDSNNTEKGRQRNRRVNISVLTNNKK